MTRYRPVTSYAFKFLVIGAGRGGTSLLAGLLDAHSQLEVGFERFSAAYLMGTGLPLDFTTTPATLAQDRAQLFRSACCAEAARHPQKLWGDKITTEHLGALREQPGINTLDLFFNRVMPDIKIIFILRDGRTCVRSKVTRTGQEVGTAIERWRYSVEVWRWLGGLKHRVHRLRYEDLVTHPTPVLEAVCTFLHIPFESDILQGTNSDKMRPEYRAHGMRYDGLSVGPELNAIAAQLEPELRECGYL